jgi:hypothetical protein
MAFLQQHFCSLPDSFENFCNDFESPGGSTCSLPRCVSYSTFGGRREAWVVVGRRASGDVAVAAHGMCPASPVCAWVQVRACVCCVWR